jgi:hypothetical protein
MNCNKSVVANSKQNATQFTVKTKYGNAPVLLDKVEASTYFYVNDLAERARRYT